MDDPKSVTPLSTIYLAHLQNDGTGQSLEAHLRSVSQFCKEMCGKVGLEAAGSTLGLLHDIGKYSSAFQEYLRRMALDEDTEQYDGIRGRIDHSTAGAQTIWRTLKSKGNVEGTIGEMLAICLASHHSGLIDCIAPDGSDRLTRRMNKADSESHYCEVWSKAERRLTEEAMQYLANPDLIAKLRAAIASICRAGPNDMVIRFKVGLLVRFLFSCLIDADRTDTADSAKPVAAALRQHGRYTKWTELAHLLELELERFKGEGAIDHFRRHVSKACFSASNRQKGIFTLTVPTGGGKTLASLRFALHHAAERRIERVIYVSPYTSIIDQNADVVRKILEPPGTDFGTVVLEHHSNLTPLKETWRSKILSENWDAPVIFTTAVQVLEALFGAGTRSVRRMHQMAQAVLIFDEIQTLPVRAVHLFNNAMNFLVEHCGSTVVLCTATQPLLHRVDSGKGAIRLDGDAEIMPHVADLFSSIRRCTIIDRRKPGGWEHADAAQLAASQTAQSGSCLMVVNTKAEARSIFTQCQSNTVALAVYHLSTSMCPAHRLKVLRDVKEHIRAGNPVICVSTQLIEAGVDIDFASVVRALAGLDSIAQATGRCNRHWKRDTGQVHIVNLAGELPKKLQDIRAAQEAAQRVLDEDAQYRADRIIEASDPALIERYFRYYFFERRNEMDYPVHAGQAERDDTLLNLLSENRLAVAARTSAPPVYMRQAFMTAAEAFQSIDGDTRGVIVPYSAEGKAIISELCSSRQPERHFVLVKRAQGFAVNVFPHVLKRLQDANAVYEAQEGTGILCLDEKYYNGDFGLNVAGTEEMELQDA